MEQFPFQVVREQHSQILSTLRPNGSNAGLFDTIKFCLDKFDKLNQMSSTSHKQCLYILTDGHDDFSTSGNQQHFVSFVQKTTRKLNVDGYIIQVGNRNLLTTKLLCDRLDYKFYHFDSTNAYAFARTF